MQEHAPAADAIHDHVQPLPGPFKTMRLPPMLFMTMLYHARTIMSMRPPPMPFMTRFCPPAPLMSMPWLPALSVKPPRAAMPPLSERPLVKAPRGKSHCQDHSWACARHRCHSGQCSATARTIHEHAPATDATHDHVSSVVGEDITGNAPT